MGSLRVEANAPGLGWRLRVHELFDCLDQNHDLLVMVAQFSLKLGDLACKLLVSCKHFAELDKGTNHKDTNFDGLWRVQDAGGHDGTMLREGVREGLGELEFIEVVAICDHLGFLFGRELEHEILGEALLVALHLLVHH